MAKQDATVNELVRWIERGEIKLPEMQRGYVWRSTRVRDLIDSLYRGYPSGAILLWETDMEVAEREFAVSQGSSGFSSNKLLLDGQQRLTSLSAIIRGEPVHVRGRKAPIDLLFNLEHPDKLDFTHDIDETTDSDGIEDEVDASQDEIDKRLQKMTFVVSTKKLSRLPYWVSVTQVFKSSDNTPFLTSAGVTELSDPNVKKYTERLNKLRDIEKYTYRLDVLERSLSYEEVTEIFVRVNSLGAKLRGSDLALAQITAKWRNSLALFDDVEKKCSEKGFRLEVGHIVRNLIVHVTGQSKFLTVNTLSQKRLQDNWDIACEGLEFALDFLINNLKINSLSLLSSPYFPILISYFCEFHDCSLNKKQESGLKYWLLIASAKGRYSRGSSESMLDQDLSTIRNGGGVDGLLANLKRQFGRLDIEADDLAGRNQRSAYFKTMFLAFKYDGAKDWTSRLDIAIDHSGSKHKLQFHHIFPKNYLKDRYSTQEINDICNLAFIGGKTNRKISDKAPEHYIAEYVSSQGQESFDKQCIPINEEILKKEQFRIFLERRRILVMKRLNSFIREISAFEA